MARESRDARLSNVIRLINLYLRDVKHFQAVGHILDTFPTQVTATKKYIINSEVALGEDKPMK